jgi:hypothetical protein
VVDTLWQDLKHGVRGLAAAPGFTAVVVLAACGGASPSSPSPSPSGLRLTATISQTILQQGEIATLTFRLENTGSSAVKVQFPSACQITTYIATESGTVVYPGGGAWACAQIVTALSLGPGEAKTEQLRIRGGLSDMSSVYGLPAGRYVAYARIDGSYVLQSAPVPFTVLDR